MAKKTTRTKYRQHKTLLEIDASRTGGHNALMGYSYQQLYSCLLLLTKLNKKNQIRFEGIEDVDLLDPDSAKRIYIQLKFSKDRQSASFMDGILKNFLEVYFAERTSSFKLVYDFSVADGKLKKLFDNKLDGTTKEFWLKKIEAICIENKWKTTNISAEAFLNSIQFEYNPRGKLEQLLVQEVIKRCNLNTTIQRLYIYALEFFCFDAMRNRKTIEYKNIVNFFSTLQDDIDHGFRNPAITYFTRISFKNNTSESEKNEYYEGKKATLSDIISNLPVRRKECEGNIENSILKNTITVIKASSGQGKTTLAWQVCYNLQNDFTIYQLTKCDEQYDIHYISDFLKTRIFLGEKVLILIDNLNIRLKLWNELAQRLEQELEIHYKLLITTREDDWYSFSGGIHNLKSLNIVNIYLDEQSAEQIFDKLKRNNLLHSSVNDWHYAWDQVQNRKLLIEYVYLLTHGKMITERIDGQIKILGNGFNGKVACEILRYVCFADICGIQLQTNKLLAVIRNETSSDLSEILKTLDKEFLIKIDTSEKQHYIDGLHPVRSQHIIERLHEFISIDETILQVIKIIDKEDLSIISSFLPSYVVDKNSFYKQLTDFLGNDYQSYNSVFEGIFSGTAINYYRTNKVFFDEANQHYGLELFCISTTPFVSENNYIDQLWDIHKNENLEALKNLCQKLGNPKLKNFDIYIFSNSAFLKLRTASEIDDLESFIKIANHLFHIDKCFILADKIDLREVWNKRDYLSLSTVELLFYNSFIETPDTYNSVINFIKKDIFAYIKEKTNSLKLYESDKDIHVEYIVYDSNLETINEESVNRLKTIARIFPFYEHYCSKVCKPRISLFSAYEISHLGVKSIPANTFSKLFKSDYGSLWNKSILSNYEESSVYEWLNFWINTRQIIVTNLENCYKLLCYRLKCDSGNSFINTINSSRLQINENLGISHYFPHSQRPFENAIEVVEIFEKETRKYFSSINFFVNQFSEMLNHTEKQNLAFLNLSGSYNNLSAMQKWFEKFCNEKKIFIKENTELCKDEINILKKIRDASEFYLENKPSKYFSTTSLVSYHDKKDKIFLKQIEDSLSVLKSNFSVLTPNSFLNEGFMKIYPLVVNEFDFSDEERMNLFTICIASLALNGNSQISFVQIAFVNSDSFITFGLSFPFDYILQIYEIINGKDVTNIEKMPIPLTSNSFDNQFISCFDAQLKIQETKEDAFPFVKILSKLWEYSKYRENLKEDRDIKYLQSKLKNLVLEINLLSNDLEDLHIQVIQDLCNKVYNGMIFDDIKYNEYFEKFYNI